MIPSTARSLQRRKPPQACQATTPRARNGIAVTVPVRKRSRRSFWQTSTSLGVVATAMIYNLDIGQRGGL
jgi:hypothetical protein